MRWKRWSLWAVLRRWVMGGAALTVITCTLFCGFEDRIQDWESRAGIRTRDERFLVVYRDGFARISATHWATSSFIDATTITEIEGPALSRVLGTYREDAWRRVPGSEAPEWLAGVRYETGFGTYSAIRTYGWPWRAMRTTSYRGRPGVPLPVGALWDTVVLGGVLLPIAWLLPDSHDIRRLWKRIRGETRAERGLCLKCGYDLRGDYASGCPECGCGRG